MIRRRLDSRLTIHDSRLSISVGAVRLGAVRVDMERMVVDLEAAVLRDLFLALLDLGIEELLDVPALHAHQVIVVPALVQLEHRLAGLEMVADQQPRLLELGEHPVDRREPGIGPVLRQYLVDILGGQMAHGALLEQLEYAQARQRRFQAYRLQIAGGAHGASLSD